MEDKTIYLKDKNSGQTLASFSVSELTRAFEVAGEYEELGIDVDLVIPTLIQEFALSLGHTPGMAQTKAFEKSVENELQDHQSCCIEDSSPEVE